MRVSRCSPLAHPLQPERGTAFLGLTEGECRTARVLRKDTGRSWPRLRSASGVENHTHALLGLAPGPVS
jgi:hypothetical protein